MNDLISRKTVLDWLREQQKEAIIRQHEPHLSKSIEGANYVINAAINFIVQMPVAYDVNKVVEQLKRLDEDGLPMRSAINFVRKGDGSL